MERALSLEAITSALGQGPILPTPEELQEKLVDAEMALFFGSGEVDDELVAAAWYLHSVGSADPAGELYSVERRKQAHRIAAHIFDLAVKAGPFSYIESLEMTFAAQVSYLRGDLTPNAMALLSRAEVRSSSVGRPVGAVALEVGASFLGMDVSTLFPRIRDQLQPELRRLRERLEVEDLIGSPFGAVERVVRAVWNLIIYITYGDQRRLENARGSLRDAIGAEHASGDLDSRWVAAHLLDIADGLGDSAVWALLPPDVPHVGRAMTLGEPPIFQLWPPQVELFTQAPNPLDPEVRRLILSLPTSAGKTLTAQMIVSTHLARGNGSVCVVVPTHSLAREVRRDLRRRLSLLRTVVEDMDGIGMVETDGPQAVVMTPETLSAQLRSNPQRVLADYTMFVFDEAHLVADRERGWVLESVLSYIHQETLESEHRIVLLSAALGNQAHYTAWMGDEQSVVHKDWRGPRRAHAVWTTIPDRNTGWEYSSPKRSNELPRRTKPRRGQIRIRTSPGQYRLYETQEPVGVQVDKWTQGDWKRDGNRSTSFYEMRVVVAEQLGGHGPVLVIEGTKQNCQRFAEALASRLDDEPTAQPLVNLVVSRLEEQHPLARVLRKGVGFHHASLPEDVQAELEDAVRRGQLRYLVSTTTLIEGINLPVRSVLIGERGYHEGEGFVETLDPARLLNAVGRAGRATKETEGWVVLNENYRFREELFDELAVEAADINVESRLVSESALESLARFEELIREGEDAVFHYTGSEASDFISHVWFVAAALEELDRAFDEAGETLQHTLAWQQMDEETRQRWLEVSRRAIEAYAEQPDDRRRRWARSGTSITTAVRLEGLSKQITAWLVSEGSVDDPVAAFALVAESGRLEEILDLPEISRRAFKATRQTPRTETLDVDYAALISSWISGTSLVQIGEAHLQGVNDEDFRYEQLSEFAANVLEHFLPWTLQTIVTWVNEKAAGVATLCPELAAHTRFGTPSSAGLELMRLGVRSRRLVNSVLEQFEGVPPGVELRPWLGQFDLSDWRDRFRASPNELGDLLTFVRDRNVHLSASVLAGDSVSIDVSFEGEPGPVRLGFSDQLTPSRIGVWRHDSLLGHVQPRHHEDLERLLVAGVPLDVQLQEEFVGASLLIRALAPDTDPAWFDDA